MEDWSVFATLESLSNDDGDGNENVKKQNNNFINYHAVFVRFFAVIAWLRRETASFHVLWRTWTQDIDFFSWTSIQTFRIQLQKNLPTFDELNEVE